MENRLVPALEPVGGITGMLEAIGGLAGTLNIESVTNERRRASSDGKVRTTENGDVLILPTIHEGMTLLQAVIEVA